MKKLIEFLITSIINYPEKIVIEESINEINGYTTYILSVDPQDMGRVIGKRGKIIKALRNIIHAAAIKKAQKVIFFLKEEQRDLPSQQQ